MFKILKRKFQWVCQFYGIYTQLSFISIRSSHVQFVLQDPVQPIIAHAEQCHAARGRYLFAQEKTKICDVQTSHQLQTKPCLISHIETKQDPRATSNKNHN